MDEGTSRNARSCLIVAAILVLLMMVPVVFFWVLLRSFEADEIEISGGTILEVDLGAVVGDGPFPVDLGPFFGSGPLSLWELNRALDTAAEDDDIVGVHLLIRGSAIGWAGAEEVLSHLDAVRAAGKPVHALLESDLIDDHDYFLATGANRILVSPAASAAINGIAAEAQFMRGTFDKLHIEPEVFMYKEYKSAGEGYANYEMSPYMRESLTAVLATTHERLLARIADRRGLDEAAVAAFMERGIAAAEHLEAAGLADALGYSDELRSGLERAAGVEDYKSVTVGTYLSAARPAASTRPEIALIFGEGPIVVSAPPSVLPFFQGQVFSGERVARHIREAAEDDDIRAIVFRVSSPGGSPVGSDLVRREIANARERGKTVVVSMGDVAGSGGYWVAMDADAIVAQPTTLTGSIGVVFTKLNLDGFYEWIGTRVERITTAPEADLLSLGPLGEAGEQAVLSWMDSVYGRFTGHVARARELDPDEVAEIARGRVWSGADALELGLVDSMGGLAEAFVVAKERIGLDPEKKVPILVLPRQRSFWQQLFENDFTGVATRPIGDELASWVRELAAPQVQVRSPSFRLR
ncbi:MAG: S49 family peptidase [Acidobacteriota bacterium]|nr:S49 family peptidase [Acidobacteriota bacterium]